MPEQTLGEIIRNARIAHKLTQAQLAEKAGKVQQFISQVESGKRNVTVGSLIAIFDALGYRVKFEFVPKEDGDEVP